MAVKDSELAAFFRAERRGGLNEISRQEKNSSRVDSTRGMDSDANTTALLAISFKKIFII